jgi:hypothetical protein
VTFAIAEPNGWFMEALEGSGCSELIGSDAIFPSVDLSAQAYVLQHPESVPPSRGDG